MADREELERAMKSGGPVRIFRKGMEDAWIEGFVIGCGPEFFVMAVLDDAPGLDGFGCLRYTAVSKCVNPAPSAGAIAKALRAQGERPERPEELAAPELADILKFASRRYGLVTIEDQEDPEGALIGRVRLVSASFLQIRFIGPDADWDPELTEMDFDEIRRVDFGGAFEQDLWREARSRSPD